MALQIDQFMCRSDNFGVLVHDPKSGETALIDAPEETADPGGDRAHRLDADHDPDHASPSGPCRGQPGAEEAVRPDDHRAEGRGGEDPRHRRRAVGRTKLEFAGQPVEVIETPGHTAGHISYLFPEVACRLRRRHAVCAGLRPAARAPGAGDVPLAEEARGAAGRHARLLRPRIHAGQCPLRADRRPDQFGAEGARGEDREAARQGQADAADDASARNLRPIRSCAGTTR